MKTLGEFLKEHKAGPGFKFDWHGNLYNHVDILYLGKTACFCFAEASRIKSATEIFLDLNQEGEWRVYTPPKKMKTVKLLACRSKDGGQINWVIETILNKAILPIFYSRVPESDTEAKVEDL